MQIVEVNIENFRGIKTLKKSFYGKKVVCFIGRGDSGKSTLLDSISYALSPSWNLPFNDNDFYNIDLSNNIKIEVTMIPPKEFINEDKYGLYLRGLDKATHIIHDDLKDEHEKVLTIQLVVQDDLEPKWYVYNERQEEILKEINHRDRAKLNCFMVSDYIEKHFTWNRGTPLNSILRDVQNVDNYQNKFIQPIRTAIENINEGNFAELNTCFTNEISSHLVSTKNTKTLMELKDISFNSNNISLHDSKDIPYRLKGKGSKRLLSIAIQLANVNKGAVILIDEIEQGLEPDRVKKLVHHLKNERDGQIFLTTHSSNVITELGAENICLIRNLNERIEAIDIPTELNDIVRACPEAFFANKVIICEGKTEIGICRSIDKYRNQNNKNFMAYQGCVYTLGEGSNFAKYGKHFNQLGFDTLIFCDSDTNCTPTKEELNALGINICDCENGNCIEAQVFQDLPFDAAIKLIEYVIEDKYDSSETQFVNSVKGKDNNFPANWREKDEVSTRESLIKSSRNSENKSSWFKRINHGEFLGDTIFEYYDKIDEDKHLKIQLNKIIDWVGT